MQLRADYTGGPTAQVCRPGPKVGGRLTLFCIHRVNSYIGGHELAMQE